MTAKLPLSVAALLAIGGVVCVHPAAARDEAGLRTSHLAGRTSHVAQQQPDSPGLILGRVVDATNGAPVSSAVVRLMNEAGAAVGPGLLTGPDGRFVFSPLSAGVFMITAERAGYLDGQYGRKRPSGDGAPLILRTGERRADATIQLWPWSSISGTVIDEMGRRVPGVPIEAMRRGAEGAGAATTAGSAVTDARGEYQIQRLPPGTYVVAAICHAITLSVPSSMPLPSVAVTPPAAGTGDPTFVIDSARRSVLAVTGPIWQPRNDRERAQPFVYVTSYYGGATSLWQAHGLDVAPGQQLTNIDMSLSLKPTARIAGAVVGPKGPVAEAMIRLLATDLDPSEIDSETPDVVTAMSGLDGRFALPPVPRGNYLMDVYRPRPAPALDSRSPGVPRLDLGVTSSRDPEGYWARTSVTVTERDIPDFLITMRAGVKLAGEVSFQRPPGSVEAQPFRLVLEHGDDPPVTSSAIRTDRPGSFEIAGVRPGWYVLSAVGLPAGWEISSALLGGREITGMPFEVGGNEGAALTVTLGDRATEVRGDVLDAQGRAVRDATAVLISTDISGWKAVSRTARNVQAIRTSNGGYAFRGLAAGEYYLIAVDDSVMEGFPATEVLRKLINGGGALRLRLVAGERRVENLTVRPKR